MKAVIYSRKSKFTGKGESVENQVQMCREYAYNHFNLNDEDITIYEDEGFSGSNTDRPQFKQMLIDAKNKKFDILICYRLDRISRNIADFSSLIEELHKYNVSFISIREQFDTSTPMGRAMMYIASVFAQLERETIAERVRDNMHQLAQTGRWLGGMTPTGFESKEIVYTDKEGKSRKLFKLTPITEEIEIVKLIFDKYVELKSLTQLDTYLLNQNIKTKNNIDYTRFAIRFILENPVYAIADQRMYNYLDSKGCNIYSTLEEFDGTKGIMGYNKTKQDLQGTKRKRDYSEWIIAVGKHKGIIPSNIWIQANQLLDANKDKSFYTDTSTTGALLSGLLICSKCGSFMRPNADRVMEDGTRRFYYRCLLKERSKGKKCDCKNIRGDVFDKKIKDTLKEISEQQSQVRQEMSQNKTDIEFRVSDLNTDIEMIKANIEKNNTSMDNLINVLSEGQENLASKRIIEQINKLEEENASLKERLLALEEKAISSMEEGNEVDYTREMLISFKNLIDTLDVDGQKNLIRCIIEKITWDGKKIDMVLFGANVAKK